MPKEQSGSPLAKLWDRYPVACLIAYVLFPPGSIVGVNALMGANGEKVSIQVSESVKSTILETIRPEMESLSARFDKRIDGLELILTERIDFKSRIQDERYQNHESRIADLSERIDRYDSEARSRLDLLSDRIDTNRSNYRLLRNALYTEHHESGVHKSRPSGASSGLLQQPTVHIAHGEKDDENESR